MIAWHKSSYSSDNQGECVEVGVGLPHAVPVRDSKDPHGPALHFTPTAFTAFLADLKEARLSSS